MTRTDYPANDATGPVEGLLKLLAALRIFGPGVRPERPEGAESNIEPAFSLSDQCESGGYNEAFVMQHWANYDPSR